MDSRTEKLRDRTKEFAIRIIHLFQALPSTKEAQVIGNQLLRCGTAVGANYRSACHARSRADFISKIGIVTEEADECVFWIELLSDFRNRKKGKITRAATGSSRADCDLQRVSANRKTT
jgi:four helix bundle protein